MSRLQSYACSGAAFLPLYPNPNDCRCLRNLTSAVDPAAIKLRPSRRLRSRRHCGGDPGEREAEIRKDVADQSWREHTQKRSRLFPPANLRRLAFVRADPTRDLTLRSFQANHHAGQVIRPDRRLPQPSRASQP